MEDTRLESARSIRRRTPDWLLAMLRLLLVVLVAKPAVSKFVTYGSSVAFFDAVGMPAPAATVVVAGLVEVMAVFLLIVGRGERIAALSLIPVMIVAILYVGPDWKNLAVLAGSLALFVGETGSVVPRRIATRAFE